jgi:BirA family biotin operon repressor/biotin-[acetyl-CoA-carboxylase] ligase
MISSDPPVLFARELSSTNDDLKRLAEVDRINPWTVLVCALQTKGRGRPGNRWVSRRGDLMMSQWIENGSFLSPKHLPISLFVASACLSVLDTLGYRSVFWKYPNDIYASGYDFESAGKIGGILVEPAARKESDRSLPPPGWVCGVGLNLLPRQTDSPEEALKGGDLGARGQNVLGLSDLPNEKVCGADREGTLSTGPLKLAAALAGKVREVFLERSEDGVRSHLEDRLLWKNRWIVYSLSGRNGVGLVTGLGPGGELRLTDSGGHTCFLGAHVRNVRLLSESGSS